jgi:hypothetical protein
LLKLLWQFLSPCLFRGLFNFQRGDQLPVWFQPLGANTAQRLNVTGWDGSREVVTFDVTNTGSGGNTARLGGKRDGSGKISMDWDADVNTFIAPFTIIEGISGIILEYTSATKFIQTPIIIQKIDFSSATTSQLKYVVNWQMNSIAGLYVLPASNGS